MRTLNANSAGRLWRVMKLIAAGRLLPRPVAVRLLPLSAAGLVLLQGPGRAADPVLYQTRLVPTGEAGMDAALSAASSLVSLAAAAPVGPFALVARARSDAGRFATVLQSYGYYGGQVAIAVDGHPLDDPALPDLLDRLAATQKVTVTASFTPGPEYHLGQVALHGDVPAEARTALKLAPGDPAHAADVLAAQGRLLTALRDSGHALAKVSDPVATLEAASHTLDIGFEVQAGPRVDLGAIRISGLGRLREDYVRRHLLLHPGEPYDPATLDHARDDLSSIGAIASVRIETPDTLDPQGRLPVDVVVAERPLHALEATIAFSTDQGGTLSTSWTDRDLFGRAEQLTLRAAATGLGGSASKQPGYLAGATLLLPDWLQRDQSLTFNLTGVRESLEAYDRTALIAGVGFSRKLSPHWTASIGLTGEKAHFVQEQVGRDYTLLQVPIGLGFDNTTSLLDPVRGLRAAAVVTPTGSLSGQRTGSFTIAQLSASTYLDIHGNGRGVLALRALVGSVQGASVFDIPPDQRYYGGGGGTIRGYRFQSVGPAFPDGKPTGGTSIDVGTVEFRQRFGESFGAVAFVDAGQVGTGAPFQGSTRIGAGLGARYYTSIGPIRFDVAVPLIHQKKSDLIEAYIGLGQAF